MKSSRTLLAIGLACIASGGVALAQGNGKGHGGGGGGGDGGGGGGTPPMPAIAYNQGGHLAVMDADGGNPTVILPYAGSSISMEPSWSPDGMYIVFNGTIAGSGIYVVNVDGSGLTLLKPANVFDNDNDGIPDSTGFIGYPDWSPVPAPDGRYKILFVEEVPYAGGGTSVEVMAINLDGTGYQQLTDDYWDFPFDVSWSPTAEGFATASVDFETFLGDCKVYDLSAVDGVLSASAGTSVSRVPGSPLESAPSIGWVDWANGSNTLAVAANPDGWDIWIVDVQNPANPLRIDHNATERKPSWSPDDSRIVYWRTGPGPDGIFTLDALGGGDPVELSRSGKAPDWLP